VKRLLDLRNGTLGADQQVVRLYPNAGEPERLQICNHRMHLCGAWRVLCGELRRCQALPIQDVGRIIDALDIAIERGLVLQLQAQPHRQQAGNVGVAKIGGGN
jgi:hypothetical protein